MAITNRVQAVIDSDDPNVFMKEAGYRMLGEGGEGSVWEKKGGTGEVVKLIKKQDSKNWKRFIGFCRANKNKHYPKFGAERIERHGGVDFLLVRVEKLRKASEKDEALVGYICDKIRGKRLFDPKDPGDVEDASSIVGKDRLQTLLTNSTLEQAIRALVKRKAGRLEEIEFNNTMKRGDTLVIIDA